MALVFEGKRWEAVRLGEIAEFRNGLNFTKSNFGTGLKVIGVRDFQDYSVPRYESLDEINPAGIAYEDSLLRNNDILFVRSNGNRDLIGRSLFITALAENVSHSGFTIRLRFPSTKIFPRFYAYLFRTSAVRQTLSAYGGGTNINNLNQKILAELQIPLPPLIVQEKIAAILSAYDDLIENNLRRIKMLEETAQTIYREWFVKFRFPGHQKVKMVNSPLGKIPEGWKIGNIDDLVNICSGFAFKSSTFVDIAKYKLITIKNVKDGAFVDESDSQIEEIPRSMPDHCFLHSGDILLSLTGNVGRACLVFGQNFLMNQRVAKLVPRKVTNRSFIYFMFREADLQKKLEMISTGVAQQNLSPILMGKMKILIPPEDILDGFSSIGEPMCEGIISLCLRNRNLRQTRDLLLPKLISGELDVSELDITIPEANA
jgi:type I restriction enzyme S subunit